MAFTNGETVDDVTEPAFMDKIRVHLETLHEDDQDFMEQLLDKVNDTFITWEQPWYQKNNYLTRPIKNNPEEPFETNSFTKIENVYIEKRWKKFCKKYDLPDTPICLARWRSKGKSRNPRNNTPEERARRYVMCYLARGLKRNLYQVYKHFVTHFGYPNKGPYSSIEEQTMDVVFYHCPNNAVTILSRVLSREPRGIYNRLKEKYQGKPESKRVKWNLPLASKFLNLLMKHSGCSLEELKNRQFNTSVWKNLEKDMDHQHSYLREFWYNKLHVQLFVRKDVKLKKIRKSILEKLKMSDYEVWSDIRWKKFTELFPEGYTYSFINREARAAFGRTMKNYMKVPVSEAVEYALHNLKHTENRRLKTLKLNSDGCLEFIQYDEE